jgi:uncharacterized phage protein (TIGR01671 family)
MREFKFRVWDDVNMFAFDFNDVRIGILDPTGYGVSEPVIMQYTGLKDKNGKEIYEGDVIQYKDTINNGYRDIEVTRKEKVAYGLGCFSGGFEESLASVRKKSIVIGNIYENPELIN